MVSFSKIFSFETVLYYCNIKGHQIRYIVAGFEIPLVLFSMILLLLLVLEKINSNPFCFMLESNCTYQYSFCSHCSKENVCVYSCLRFRNYTTLIIVSSLPITDRSRVGSGSYYVSHPTPSFFSTKDKVIIVSI